jgi:hypothetical protein
MKRSKSVQTRSRKIAATRRPKAQSAELTASNPGSRKNRDAWTRRANHLQKGTVCKINFKLLHENFAHGANTSAANC